MEVIDKGQYMKKTILIILSFIIMILSVACTQTNSKVDNYYYGSKAYTDDEIKSAIDLAEKEFKKKYSEKLKKEDKIYGYYPGDIRKEWVKYISVDEARDENKQVIIINTDLKVLTKDKSKPFEVLRFKWILIREKEGEWKVLKEEKLTHIIW